MIPSGASSFSIGRASGWKRPCAKLPISRLCVLVKINRLAERQLRVQTLQGDGGPSKALDQGALDGGT
jgi:hypothetical protein